VINAYSGRYVTLNGSGNYVITTASSTKIDGWIDTAWKPNHNQTATSASTPFTCSATEGGEVLEGTVSVHTENSAIWMPIYTGETLVASNKGAAVDLAVTGGIQYVRPSVTTHKQVIILEVDLVKNQAAVYANSASS